MLVKNPNRKAAVAYLLASGAASIAVVERAGWLASSPATSRAPGVVLDNGSGASGIECDLSRDRQGT
jgi:hypothetical protein